MKKLRFFYGVTQDDEAISKALNTICDKISLKTGVGRFIIKDGFAILSGSETESNMLLELSQVKTDGAVNFYANLFFSQIEGAGGEVSWQQWDFENPEAFFEHIADYISPFINRTIKFTTRWKRKEGITFTTAALNESTGKWETILEETIDYQFVAFWIRHDKTVENICVFNI